MSYCSGKGQCSHEMYSPSTHNDEFIGGCPVESKHMYTSRFCDDGVAECGHCTQFDTLQDCTDHCTELGPACGGCTWECHNPSGSRGGPVDDMRSSPSWTSAGAISARVSRPLAPSPSLSLMCRSVRTHCAAHPARLLKRTVLPSFTGHEEGDRGIVAWRPSETLGNAGVGTPSAAGWSDGTGASGTVAPGAGATEYRALRKSMVIDADLVDWQCLEYRAQVPFQPTGTHSSGDGDPWVQFDEYSGGIWHGPLDHSSAFAFAWDVDNIYMATKVIDDTHQLNGNSGWNGDSIQIVFANAEQDTVLFLYNYAISMAGDIVAHHERGPGGTQAAIFRDEPTTSTYYEFKFTAASMGRDHFSGNTQIGIGACVNDGDLEDGQGGQKGWSGWGPYGAVYGKNAQATVLIRLVDENAQDCAGGPETNAPMPEFCGNGQFTPANPPTSMPAGLGDGMSYNMGPVLGDVTMPDTCPGDAPGTPACWKYEIRAQSKFLRSPFGERSWKKLSYTCLCDEAPHTANSGNDWEDLYVFPDCSRSYTAPEAGCMDPGALNYGSPSHSIAIAS